MNAQTRTFNPSRRKAIARAASGGAQTLIDVSATAAPGVGNTVSSLTVNCVQDPVPLKVTLDKRGRVSIFTMGQRLQLPRAERARHTISARRDYEFTVAISTPANECAGINQAIDLKPFETECCTP